VQIPPLVVHVAVMEGSPTAVAVYTAPSGSGPTVVVLPARTPPRCTMMVGSGSARGAAASAAVARAVSAGAAVVVVVPADGLVVVVSAAAGVVVVVVTAGAGVVDVVVTAAAGVVEEFEVLAGGSDAAVVPRAPTITKLMTAAVFSANDRRGVRLRP